MKIKSKEALLIGVIGLLLILAVIPGLANAVPRQINYQGYLVDSNGGITGTRDMRFTIFCYGEVWLPVWGPEEHLNVQLNKGIFNVILGESYDIPNLGETCELGVEVKYGGAYEALTPRQPLTSAAYAFRADVAGFAYSAVSTDNITTESQNTYVGVDAGVASTGASNTYMGSSAGYSNSSGSSNTFIGNRCLAR